MPPVQRARPGWAELVDAADLATQARERAAADLQAAMDQFGAAVVAEESAAAAIQRRRPLARTATPLKHERIALAQLIGGRLRAARDLCGMPQQDAAAKLGYCNSSKLAKVERGINTESIPLWLVLRAATLYQVSVDYLFGLTDDWEMGARAEQEREVSGWMLQVWEAAREKDMAAIRALNNRISEVDQALRKMTAHAGIVGAALDRVRTRNAGVFDELAAGAKLVMEVENMTYAARNADARLARFRVECRVAAVPGSAQIAMNLEGGARCGETHA